MIPQLDILSFFSQTFWIFLSFIVFYFFIIKHIIFISGACIKFRRRKYRVKRLIVRSRHLQQTWLYKKHLFFTSNIKTLGEKNIEYFKSNYINNIPTIWFFSRNNIFFDYILKEINKLINYQSI